MSTEVLKRDWQFVFGGEWLTNAYIDRVTCGNCGETDRIWIRKGLPKKAVLPIECKRCGCKEMR